MPHSSISDCHDEVVDPKTNLKYLDFLAAHLKEFVDRFEEFMEVHSRTLAGTH